MKILSSSLILGSMFVSAIAVAAPKVGDKATYKVTIEVEGVVRESTLSLEMLAVKEGSYSVRRTVEEKDSPPSVTEGEMDDHDLPPFNDVAQLDSFCTEMGGTRNVAEVGGEKVEACNVSVDTTELSAGLVPFGIVSVRDTDDKTTVTLTSFTRGQ